MKPLTSRLLPLILIPPIVLLAGCATGDSESSLSNESPTAALLRGDIAPDEYFASVRAANERARANEQFEVNREPTRAFNTVTGRVEYVPEGTAQSWNPATQRWEFTPRR